MVRWGILAWLSDMPTGFFRRVRRIAKSASATSCLAVRPSIYPHGATRLPMKGFSWNFIFERLSATCRENSSFIKIWRERLFLYVDTCVHLWHYLAEVSWEWEMFQTRSVKKIKNKHFIRHFIVQPMHTNYKILRLLKYLKLWKLLQHVSVHVEPSSGSLIQYLAKITYLVPM